MYNQKTRSLTQRYIQRATVSVQQWLNSIVKITSMQRKAGHFCVPLRNNRFENRFKAMAILIQIHPDLSQIIHINAKIISSLSKRSYQWLIHYIKISPILGIVYFVMYFAYPEHSHRHKHTQEFHSWLHQVTVAITFTVTDVFIW
jgi:hypothetical protein